jgi:hypothetical protein
MPNYVTLTGTINGLNSLPVTTGQVSFYPSAIPQTFNVSLAPDGFSCALSSTGTFSIELLATDNVGVGNTNWFWTMTVNAPGAQAENYPFFLTYANGATQTLSSVIELTEIPVGLPLEAKNNLSDLPSSSAALANLGGLKASNNLSDVPDPATALANLGSAASSEVLALAGGTLTGPVSNTNLSVFHLDNFSGSDDQKMASALTTVIAAGGGTIQLAARAHTFANQWSTSYSAGVVTPLRIAGNGVGYNGMWSSPNATTTCTFTYSGAGAACMDFQHLGSIELSGIRFKSANMGVPLFQTTNASPNIHDNVFSGGGSGVGCITDAIVLGGSGSVYGAGDTAPYQGYQGQIYRNFFDGIRRLALFQTSSNSIQIHENTISTSCGSGLQFGACIEFNDTVNNTTGNHIWGNVVEMVNYPVFIKCTSGAILNTFGPNGLYDTTSLTLTYHLFVGGGNNTFNNVLDGFRSDSTPLVVDFTGDNTVQTFHQSQGSVYREPHYWFTDVVGRYLDNANTSPRMLNSSGDFATIGAVTDAPNASGYATINLNSGNCTEETDGATYLGSNWVTSLTAAFTSADVYSPITGTGIVAPSYITLTATPTTAWPWVANGKYNLGDISRPIVSNGHLYQVTTGGTASSSQPTWPTGGGTVTDGSVVWQDLGTTATAALVSTPCSATNTGLTIKFGRIAGTRTIASFSRFHFWSQGSAPSGAADAGAGSGPSGISTTGTDHAFTFNITTGSATTTGDMFHVNPAQAWPATPNFNVTAGNAATAALLAGGYWYSNGGGVLTLSTVNAPNTGTAFIFHVIAMC